ncbi:hypothetical protein H2199_005212 [Coniosporium tulheliwenetii]|uniref:Uncharacterized protein n=1 Tax=Coniosporium tulheliwenetii TaxID=3383036 RepID=A0ACC2Z3M6_9PEZI|nr:hypothetical protein H2199_005212 [Cladosporium sp. JES 115]
MVLKPGVAPDVGDLLQQVKVNARALSPRRILLNNYLEVLASHVENGFRAVLVEIPRPPLFPPTTPTYEAGNVAAQPAVTSADGFTVLLQGPTALTWNDAVMALFKVVAEDIAQKIAETEKKAEPVRVKIVKCPLHEGYELHYLQEGRLDGKYIYVPGNRPPKPDMIPPPVGARIGSKHVPWLELTEFEIGHERRRRRGTVPHGWMPNVEETGQILSALSRGLDNKRMAQHAAEAGEGFLDEEPDITRNRTTLDELQAHVSGPIHETMGNFTEKDMKRVRALAAHLKGSTMQGHAAEEKGLKYTAEDLLDLYKTRATNWKAFPELRRSAPPSVGSEAATAVEIGAIPCGGGTTGQPLSSAKQAVDPAVRVEERDAAQKFQERGGGEEPKTNLNQLLDQCKNIGEKVSGDDERRPIHEELEKLATFAHEVTQGIVEEKSKKMPASKSKDQTVNPTISGQMKLNYLRRKGQEAWMARYERNCQSLLSNHGNTKKATILAHPKPKNDAAAQATISTGGVAPVAKGTTAKSVQFKSEGVADLLQRKGAVKKAEASTDSPLQGEPEFSDQVKDRIMNMHKAIKIQYKQTSQLSDSSNGTKKVAIESAILKPKVEALPADTVSTDNAIVVKDAKVEPAQGKSEGVRDQTTPKVVAIQRENETHAETEAILTSALDAGNPKLQGLDNITTAPHMQDAVPRATVTAHADNLGGYSAMPGGFYYGTPRTWTHSQVTGVLPASPSTNTHEQSAVPPYTAFASDSNMPGLTTGQPISSQPKAFDNPYLDDDEQPEYELGGYWSERESAGRLLSTHHQGSTYAGPPRQLNNSGYGFERYVGMGYGYGAPHATRSNYGYSVPHGTKGKDAVRPQDLAAEEKHYESEEVQRAVAECLAPAVAQAEREIQRRNASLDAVHSAIRGTHDVSNRSYGNMSSAIPPFATNWRHDPPNDRNGLSFGDTSFDYVRQDKDLSDFPHGMNAVDFIRSLDTPVTDLKDGTFKVEIGTEDEAPAVAAASTSATGEPHSTFGEWKRSLIFGTTPNYGPLRKRSPGLMDSRHAVRPALASYFESDHEGDTVLDSEDELPEDLDSEYEPPEDFKVRNV